MKLKLWFKQIEEDKVRQLAIMNLAVEYDNASTTKDDLRKAYKECNDIPQEKRALIDTFLKEESNKDYKMHNTLQTAEFRITKVINKSSGWLVLNIYDQDTLTSRLSRIWDPWKYRTDHERMSEANDSRFTINEYLTKVRDNSGPGIVKPAFEENIKFEFWEQCIDELKGNVFFGKENEDPHEHIANIAEIIDLFHLPDVSRD
ncbi:hypothetical protein Tco_1437907 [Tanacetum coccineum]